MNQPGSDIIQMCRKAHQYEQQGDLYQAVKLYKRVLKDAPEWAFPHFRLGQIYKQRLEWKPCLHYHKKTIALDSSNKQAWWDVGLAATALNKRRIAKRVWAKFGFTAAKPTKKGPLAVRIPLGEKFEIIWVHPIDPVKGIITNIPHPSSGRNFNDIILFDKEEVGYTVIDQYRHPIYPELGIFKRAGYHTFSAQLLASNKADIKTLEQLCHTANLGFEVWSNATRVFAPQLSGSLPEYYGSSDKNLPVQPASIFVAIAAKREWEVLRVLRDWSIISLKKFDHITRHA